MSDPITIRAHVFYSGHVQGVGFRWTAKNIAKGYEITGWVRNLPDGRVELVAEGAENEVRSFLQAIRQSGLGSLIRHEDVNWEQPMGDMFGFQIIG